VVDPIDGTAAFMKGKPWFAVSIAVVEDGKPIAGVVFAPPSNETYAAATGGGDPERRSDPSDTDRPGRRRHAGRRQDVRASGLAEPWPPMRVESRNSIAYRLCLVAAGAFDAAVALSPKSEWDLAAADLICAEAGAC
jgi:myo-inositol-1(or 4)-monophosphatase